MIRLVVYTVLVLLLLHISYSTPTSTTTSTTTTTTISISTIVEEALAALKNDDVNRCKELLLHVLSIDNTNLDATQLLGTCYLKAKEYNDATYYMTRAVDMNQWNEPNIIANYIEALRGSKKYDIARNIAMKGLSIHPNAEQLLYNLAIVEYDDYKYTNAVRLFTDVININNKIEAWYKLINIHLDTNDYITAEHLAEKAIQIYPNDFYCYYLIGTSKHHLSKFEEALGWYMKGYEINPDYYYLKSQIGAVYQGLGLANEALQYYEKMLPFRDNDSGIRNNYGSLLGIMNRREEEYFWLAQALEIDPNMNHALINMAGNRQDEGLIEEAAYYLSKVKAVGDKPYLVSIRMAILLSPVHPSWLAMIRERNQFETKVKNLLSEIALKPDIKKETIDSTLDRIHFFIAYHGINDRYLQELVVLAYSKIIDSFNYIVPTLSPSLPMLPSNHQIDILSTKIRVGFISKFFGLFEPHGMLLDGIMKYLPRSHFDVFVLIVPSTDGKPVSPNIFEATKSVYQISLSHQDSADKIAALELDILIFADTMSEPLNHFLAHYRLASVQISFWGNPITSASKHMDYFISADCMEHPFRSRMPTDDEPYSEQVVLLDGQGIWYYKPESPDEALRKVNLTNMVSPKREFKRADFNISDNWFVYFLPQSVFKIHPLYDDVLSDILKANPNGHIIVTGGRRPLWTEIYSNRLNSSLGPFSNRLHIIDRVSSEKFLQLISIADVILHPFPFDGSRTSADALTAGKPFITLPTEYLRGRMGAAFYRSMNIPELVARNISEYVLIATKLNYDKSFYSTVTAKIKDQLHLIWENMEVPFGWSQFLMKVAGISPISWRDFITRSDRDPETETTLRSIRAANFKKFDTVINEEQLLDRGVASLETHLTTNDVPRIFNNWNGTNGLNGMSKYKQFVTDIFGNRSQLSQLRNLIKSNDLNDAYIIAERLLTSSSYLNDPLFLLEFGTLQMFRANYRDAIDLCKRAITLRPTFLLAFACIGVSSIYLEDEEVAISSLVHAYQLQRTVKQDEKLNSEVFVLSQYGLEMTLIQALLTFKRYNQCFNTFAAMSNITSIFDGGAYITVFATVQWSQKGLLKLASLEEEMLNFGLFQEYTNRTEGVGVFVSEITRLQNEYDHLLTPAVHCLSEYVAPSFRDAVFGKLSEVLGKISNDDSDHRRDSRPDPHEQSFNGVNLITQYFKSNNTFRQNGINEALKMNLLNPIISTIYLLNEEHYDFSQYNNSNKIIQVNLGRRMTFSDAFAFANDNLNDSIIAVANSDIYFDRSLSILKEMNKKRLSNTLLALSKWNTNSNGALTLQLRVDSQDAWIFRTPLTNDSIISSSPFFLGLPRCDNRIAQIFHTSGYRVINPAYMIHAIEIKDDSRDNTLYSVSGALLGEGRNVFISDSNIF